MRGSLGLLLVLTCGRKQPPPELPLPPTMPSRDAIDRSVDVEPGSYWTESGGLCLEVPEEWAGRSGAPPHVLGLSHAQTRTRFDVYAWPAGEREPPIGDEWELEFEDPNGYRTVPILSPAATATWRNLQPKGPTMTTWTGQVGDRTVRVQATFEFGHSVQGLDEVERLLEALCTTFQ